MQIETQWRAIRVDFYFALYFFSRHESFFVATLGYWNGCIKQWNFIKTLKRRCSRLTDVHGVPFLFHFNPLSPTHNCCNRWYEYRFGLLIEKPTEKSQFSSPRNVRWGSFNCGNKDSTRMSRWNYTERMWSGSRKWKISPKLLFEIITLRGSLVVRRLNKNGGNKEAQI